MWSFCLGFRDWYHNHLERCLGTLRTQHEPGLKYEILVCDSSQDPDAQVEQLCHKFGAIYVPNPEEEWSRSIALNVAARVALGERLVFTDADMLFPQNWIYRANYEIALRPTVNLWLTLSRDCEQGTRYPEPPILPEDLWRLSWPHPGGKRGKGGGMIIPRDWFFTVGGFDEFYKIWGCEDEDLTDRAEWDGQKVEWLEGTFIAHQWHTRNWPTPEQFQQVARNREYYYRLKEQGGPVHRNGR